MQIAQIAPLTEAIPPKLYGGTERVISWLADELVALGHDVVLFASGDSHTSANLEACWPRALRLRASQFMGGFGSGRYGGGPTVEQALRLDIDDMMRWGGIRAGSHLGGEMRFNFYDDEIAVKFESRVGDPGDSWLRLNTSFMTIGRAKRAKLTTRFFSRPADHRLAGCDGGSCARN